MKRISLFVLFICTIFSCLSAQTGKENERIKQNYIRSIIGMDEEKQPYLQLLSKIPPRKRGFRPERYRTTTTLSHPTGGDTSPDQHDPGRRFMAGY